MITRDNPYFPQVQLLVGVLPIVARERDFALKGGTAINLFLRNMPRLSVDIDLAYVPLSERKTALSQINAAMDRIGKSLENSGSPPYAVKIKKRQEGCACGMAVRGHNAEIKIEITPVLRGSVYPGEDREIAKSAEDAFGFAEIQLLSFEDVYAGKLVAALDRQHPRDLFDVMLLLQNEGISDRLFRAFLVYLISHDGSMARLINGTHKPLADVYEKQFVNMPVEPVSLDELEGARRSLISEIHTRLKDKERQFLLSFKRGEPDWGLLGIGHAPELPAVQWKLQNLRKMDSGAREKRVKDLEEAFGKIQ